MASSWFRGSWPPGSHTWVTGPGMTFDGGVELVRAAERITSRPTRTGTAAGARGSARSAGSPACRVDGADSSSSTSPAAGCPSATASEHMRPPYERPPSTSRLAFTPADEHSAVGLLADAGHGLGRAVRCLLARPPIGKVDPRDRQRRDRLFDRQPTCGGVAVGAGSGCQQQRSGLCRSPTRAHRVSRMRRASLRSAMRCAASSTSPP